MRGEYGSVTYDCGGTVELPPRARRILFGQGNGDLGRGTTSACAENTFPSRKKGAENVNYLRVRGEYVLGVDEPQGGEELPPRARRIQIIKSNIRGVGGTTSACAENTQHPESFAQTGRNYLRVRGEYPGAGWCWPMRLELPPRARRILTVARGDSGENGTTSACAENTGCAPTGP